MRAYRFAIRFVEPITLKGVRHAVREGVLLERDGEWAEASPLPGFSEESLNDVIEALRRKQPPPRSLRFALEALDSPLGASCTVPVNRLLQGGCQQILQRAHAANEAGCPAVKVKVGRNDLNTDIKLVRDLRAFLHDEIRLRLDANQAWSFAEASKFASALAEVDYEYVEEPLNDPQQLEALFAETGIKYALDESLLEITSTDHPDPSNPDPSNIVSQYPNAAALVCKPTILGGREAVERLASSGKPLTFSAAFETGVGIARVSQLAAEFAPLTPAGLDTLAWLDGDVLLAPPTQRPGALGTPSEWRIDLGLLERIDF